MPVPRYQPVKKRPKIMGPTIEDIDDNCLSKIIGHALAQSSINEDESTRRDNRCTERSLSLVAKRWYFLTQTLVGTYGVIHLNLDRMLKSERNFKVPPAPITNLVTRTARKPEVLAPRNFGLNRSVIAAKSNQTPAANQVLSKQSVVDMHSLRLFRMLQPKFLKYKHIILEGSLTIADYLKLMVSLDAARIERLELKIKIENAKSQAREVTLLPQQMPYLEELTLHWSAESSNAHSNGLNWVIFDRASCLKRLRILLDDGTSVNNEQDNTICHSTSKYARLPPLGGPKEQLSIEQICANFINSICLTPQRETRTHQHLNSVSFNRTLSNGSQICRYTSLLRSVLLREESIDQVDTNDGALIEHLIKSSDRTCTTRVLKRLQFLTPIKNLDLLAQLLRSKSLGTDRLSIKIDTIDNIEEVRLNMENFRQNRHESSSSQMCLYMKDQKFPDGEEKVRSLVSLSRLADVIVYVSAFQRISIDCCHLMWSVGRCLQASDAPPGKCVFKITLSQPLGSKSLNSSVEITVPFGKHVQYKININREDPSRHREIIRALKKDCYNSFVKSVRDQTSP